MFGEEYGVDIYSTPGQGTDVEVTIPVNYGHDWEAEDEERDTEDQRSEITVMRECRPLENISLCILEGEWLGFFGLSYSGKKLSCKPSDRQGRGGVRKVFFFH